MVLPCVSGIDGAEPSGTKCLVPDSKPNPDANHVASERSKHPGVFMVGDWALTKISNKSRGGHVCPSFSGGKKQRNIVSFFRLGRQRAEER